MTITFFSNFLNHHQLPLCLEFIKLVGRDNFHFVSTEPISDERLKMGYENMNVKYPFVVRAYESDENMDYALRLAYESDVAIIGSSPQVFSEIRSNLNMMTFLYRERIFKDGSWRRFYPSTAKKIYNEYIRYKNKNFYVLCASAYTANDLELCGFPRKKCLKWGYFPETKPKVEKQYEKLRIMWCGRMLWWKYPEDAVTIAHLLNEKKIDFEMVIIGNGDKRELVQEMIAKYNLQSKINLYDFMTPLDIRIRMENSNVYLFTSGKQEGWGVVLNEAMNSGCVVLANNAAGSTPYLIENTFNGFSYHRSSQGLLEVVECMLHSTSLSSISDNAYRTISDMWNPQKAAYNLIQFVKANKVVTTDGPCSYA